MSDTPPACSGPQTLPPVRVVRTETLHESLRFRVVRDVQELADGSRVDWESIVQRDSVLALPIDAEGQVYLVRQFRPQLGVETLEVVGGGVDDGHTPAEAMARELAEEAGILARLISLGDGELGVSTIRCHEHFYLAAIERFMEPDREPFEQLTMVGVERVSLEQAVDLVVTGQVRDVNSRVTILLAAEHVRRHGLPR